MPDSNETPAFNLDELKFLPAWMKEEPAAPSQYRDYQGESPSDFRRGDDRRGPRPPRSDRDRRPGGAPGGGGGGRSGPGGPRPASARPGGSGGGFADRGPRPGGGGGDRRGSRDGRPGDRGRFDDRDRREAPPAPVAPAPIRVDFLPDPRGLASIAKQIRASHLAYPLFGMARMFLSRPERHMVRLTIDPAAAQHSGNGGSAGAAASPQPQPLLFQLGEDGPVTLDRATLEKIAFDRFRDQYYATETIQKEAPKGNFTNVARERLSGTLLGPTNHHAYQTNLRALYDSRFSRRMSFEQYRRGIEVVSDPALVERWKEETRTTTVYTVRPPSSAAPAETAENPEAAASATAAEAPAPAAEPIAAESAVEPTAATAESAPEVAEAPASEPQTDAAEPATDESPAAPAEKEKGVVLPNLAAARQHFRENYFDALVRSGRSFELHGEIARTLPEPAVMAAIRQAHDREIKYPGGLVQPLRGGLQNAGLHVFKHRKRVVYVSIARPTLFSGGDGAVSENVAAILQAVAEHPLCTRKGLAELVLARRFGSKLAAPFQPETPADAPAEGAAATPEQPAPTEAASPVEAVAAETPGADTAQPAAPPAESAGTVQDAALAKAKGALAADLRYLVQAGHIIEFHNGTFDLPLQPKPKETAPAAPAKNATPAAPAKRAATPEEVKAPSSESAVFAQTEVPPDEAPAAPETGLIAEATAAAAEHAEAAERAAEAMPASAETATPAAADPAEVPPAASSGGMAAALPAVESSVETPEAAAAGPAAATDSNLPADATGTDPVKSTV